MSEESRGGHTSRWLWTREPSKWENLQQVSLLPKPFDYFCRTARVECLEKWKESWQGRLIRSFLKELRKRGKNHKKNSGERRESRGEWDSGRRIESLRGERFLWEKGEDDERVGKPTVLPITWSLITGIGECCIDGVFCRDTDGMRVIIGYRKG